MKSRYLGIVFMLVLPALGGIAPSPAAAQTVLGPEFTLIKLAVNSLQRDERQCEYFLWTKLGGDAQRVSFSYLLPNGSTDSDAPRIENVTIVLTPGKVAPTARMAGVEANGRTLWQVEMAPGVYDLNQRCLTGIPTSEGAGKQ